MVFCHLSPKEHPVYSTPRFSRVKSDGHCNFFNRFNGFLVPAPE